MARFSLLIPLNTIVMLTFRFSDTKISDSFRFELSGVTFVSNMAYGDLSGILLRSIYYSLYGLVNFECMREATFLDFLRSKLSDRNSLGSSPITEIIEMCNGFSMQKTPKHLRSYLKTVFGCQSNCYLGSLSLMEVYEDGKQVYGPDRISFLDFDSVDNVIYIDDSDEVSDELHKQLTTAGSFDEDRGLVLTHLSGLLYGSLVYDKANRIFEDCQKESFSDSYRNILKKLFQLAKQGQLCDKTVLIIERKNQDMLESSGEKALIRALSIINSATGTKILCSKRESH